MNYLSGYASRRSGLGLPASVSTIACRYDQNETDLSNRAITARGQDPRLRTMMKKGTGSVLDRENRAVIETGFSGAHSSNINPEHARYFQFLRGERGDRRLLGGEKGIRPPRL